MLENIPVAILIVFISTVILTLLFLYKASHKNRTVLLISLIWLMVQGIIAYSGFYTRTNQFPPRFFLAVFPAFLLIVVLFISRQGRIFIDRFDARTLIILHIVRIPVELVLFSLYINKALPMRMTFCGWNFDILSGLTAPIIYYFGYVNKKIGRGIILWWNIICLGLLLNIVVNAVLSAPFSFQLFAFDQPNIAVLYFPFVWLPSFIVPVVLLSHLVMIRRSSQRLS